MYDSPTFIIIHHTGILSSEHDRQLAMVNANHERRGYNKSALGFYVAYHFFIGSDGTIVQTRPLTDRTMTTRNNAMNMKSIAIVLAGNFDIEQPTQRQYNSMMSLIKRLSNMYHIPKQNVLGHQEVSPDSCPGRNVMLLLTAYRSS